MNFSQVLISLGKAGQIMSSTKQPHTLHSMPMSTKGSRVKSGGTIGNSNECTWQEPSEEKWQEDLKKLSEF